MPRRPPHPCNRLGCPLLVHTRFCDAHNTESRKHADQHRGSSSSRLYTAAWYRASRAYLRNNPLCRCDDCVRDGRLTAADTVDHIVPHRGDLALFWDQTNWQSMARAHHSRKTARHDGGFGNPIR
jgi:5-methylcytosine-specific restriction protein A